MSEKKNVNSQYLDRKIEQFLEEKATQGIEPDCKRGCSFCCQKVPLLVAPSEVDAIVKKLNRLKIVKKIKIRKAIKQLDEKYGRIAGVLKPNRDLNHSRAFSVSYRCAFLLGNICAIYDARPMMCRTYMSSSKEICKKGTGDLIMKLSDNDIDEYYVSGYDIIADFGSLWCHAHRGIDYKNGKFISVKPIPSWALGNQ